MMHMEIAIRTTTNTAKWINFESSGPLKDWEYEKSRNGLGVGETGIRPTVRR